MTKLRVVLMIAALAAACSVPSMVRGPHWGSLAASVLKIRCAAGGGTAFVVGSRLIDNGSSVVTLLTAAHVVVEDMVSRKERDLSDWKAEVPELGVLTGTLSVLVVHKILDVALLEFEVPTSQRLMMRPALLLSDAEPHVGDRVWALGYPGCERRVLTDGYLGQRGCASAHVFPGNSGGPVFDVSGHVIGVVSSVGVFSWGFDSTVVGQDMLFVPVADFYRWVTSRL